MPRLPGGVALTGALLAGAVLAGCGDGDTPEGGDLPLVGTTWTVEAYDTGEGKTQPPEGVEAVLTFAQDGTLEASLGCHHLSARFEAGSDTISVEPLTGSDWDMSDLECEGPEQDLEQAILGLLEQDVLRWGVGGDWLVLELPESVGQDWVDLRGEPAQESD